MRPLVVLDKIELSSELKARFKELGVEPVVLRTYWQACQALAAGKVDFVITSQINDSSWTQRLCRNFPHIPVLVVGVGPKFSIASQRFESVKIWEAVPVWQEQIAKLLELGSFKNQMVVSTAGEPVHFKTIQLNEVTDLLLNHFASRVSARNFIWLKSDLVSDIFQSQVSGEVQQDFNRTTYLRDQKGETSESLINTIKPFFLNRDLDVLRRMRVEDGWEVEEWIHDDKTQSLCFPVADDKAERVLGFLIIDRIEEQDVGFLEQQIAQTLQLFARHLRFSVEHWEALSQSFLDDLTALYNQRYLPLVLENEINRSQRDGQNFCVLFLDVDYFKMVNDTRGHWVGSKLLVELGRMIKETIRSSDYAFRYGGDEYVVVLVNADVSNAFKVAERLRRLVEEKVFDIDGQQLKLTVSIGLAGFPEHARTSEQILKMADQAMYYGKNKSRNVVYLAS